VVAGYNLERIPAASIRCPLTSQRTPRTNSKSGERTHGCPETSIGCLSSWSTLSQTAELNLDQTKRHEPTRSFWGRRARNLTTRVSALAAACFSGSSPLSIGSLGGRAHQAVRQHGLWSNRTRREGRQAQDETSERRCGDEPDPTVGGRVVVAANRTRSPLSIDRSNVTVRYARTPRFRNKRQGTTTA